MTEQTALTLVTVLIPARDEEGDLEACLQAIAAQDYPADRLEVIVVVGASTDGTRTVAERTLRRLGLPRAIVIDNPRGTTPSNLNEGLAKASGDVTCRVDARTRIQPHHVRTCAETLHQRPEVSVVGGAQVAVPRDATAKARGIARALNNRLTMGGSRYRRGAPSGPADTVYLGAFRTLQLLEAGGWDEGLGTNQDFELNRRMAGVGIVWFHEALASGYLPRETYGSLLRQYVRFGRAKAGYWRTHEQRPQPRQVALLLAPIAAAAALSRIPIRTWPVAMVGGLLGLDAAGVSGRHGNLAARAHAAVGIGLITGGWSAGVWAGQLAARRPPRSSAAVPVQTGAPRYRTGARGTREVT